MRNPETYFKIEQDPVTALYTVEIDGKRCVTRLTSSQVEDLKIAMLLTYNLGLRDARIAIRDALWVDD